MAAGRTKYTSSDDRCMLLFLIDELQHGNPDALMPSGFEIWQAAIDRGAIKGRSKQSLATHFRRFLLPRLDDQPITPDQRQFLKSKLILKDVSTSSEGTTSVDDSSNESGVEAPVSRTKETEKIESTSNPKTKTVHACESEQQEQPVRDGKIIVKSEDQTATSDAGSSNVTEKLSQDIGSLDATYKADFIPKSENNTFSGDATANKIRVQAILLDMARDNVAPLSSLTALYRKLINRQIDLEGLSDTMNQCNSS